MIDCLRVGLQSTLLCALWAKILRYFKEIRDEYIDWPLRILHTIQVCNILTDYNMIVGGDYELVDWLTIENFTHDLIIDHVGSCMIVRWYYRVRVVKESWV